MSDKMLIRHCSPTLAGLKTGNLFGCRYKDEKEMRDTIRSFNRLLGKKGLRILPVRYRNGRALIYVYRPSKLNVDIRNGMAERLLRERGYRTESSELCVIRLIERLYETDEFPHEIGLFLGYPPEDVYGFIENKADSCKCVGCWKVYGDLESAQKTFTKYKKCTDVYFDRYSKGVSIERLTVTG